MIKSRNEPISRSLENYLLEQKNGRMSSGAWETWTYVMRGGWWSLYHDKGFSDRPATAWKIWGNRYQIDWSQVDSGERALAGFNPCWCGRAWSAPYHVKGGGTLGIASRQAGTKSLKKVILSWKKLHWRCRKLEANITILLHRNSQLNWL